MSKVELSPVEQTDEDLRALTAKAKVTLSIAPVPRARKLLSDAVPRSAEVLVELAGTFVKREDDWAPEGTVDVTPALPEADSQGAERVARGVLTRLLSYKSDLPAYDRAQRRYLTRAAGPGRRPRTNEAAPRLTLEGGRYILAPDPGSGTVFRYAPSDGGAGWLGPRTGWTATAGPQPRTEPVAARLGPDCERVELGTLKVTKVRSTDVVGRPTLLGGSVAVEGLASARVDRLTGCSGPREGGAITTEVTWEARLVRFGTGGPWTVGQLTFSDDPDADTVFYQAGGSPPANG